MGLSAKTLKEQPTHITGSKVTSLEHEAWNDTMKGGALIPITLLPGAQSAKVFCSLRDYVII